MKLVTTKFKSGGVHEKHVSSFAIVVQYTSVCKCRHG